MVFSHVTQKYVIYIIIITMYYVLCNAVTAECNVMANTPPTPIVTVQVTVMDAWLPPFLNPFIEYMRASLPPPLYSFVVKILSHAFTAATAIIRLTVSLTNKNPSEWNAETLLPPIITLIAAYLALASLYRTASWAIRLTLFFLKWGCLIGIAMGMAGYYAGNKENGVANQGDEGFPGNVISSVFGGASSSKHNRQTKPRRATQTKPKPRDSFPEWQYRDQVEDPTTNPHAQLIMDSIVNAAGLALEGNWWSTITKLGQSGVAEASVETKGKVGKTRSR